MIEDDFVARILSEFNFFISIMSTLIRIYLDEPMNNIHYIKLRGFYSEVKNLNSFQQSNLPDNYHSLFSTINIW